MLTEFPPRETSKDPTVGLNGNAIPARPELIERQLEEIIKSEGFRQSIRMTRFLTHVVRASLRGDTGDLKETSIGVSVYDRQPGYDPKLDPVVRNEARRLRQKLQQYYESKGIDIPITILLPLGGYAPSFCVKESLRATASATDPVEPVTAPTGTLRAAVDSSPKESPGKSRQIFFWLISALVLILMITLARTFPRWWVKSPGAVAVRVTPLTSVTGQAIYPNISADGAKIAFAWDGNSNNFDIYVTQKDGRPLRLTTDAAFDLRPSWSPDGNAIAYLRSQRTVTDMMYLEVPGGQPKRLFSLKSPLLLNLTADLTQVRGNPGPSWTPDSRSLLYSDQQAGGRGLALFVRDLASGTERQLTQPEGDSRDYSPIVSADGKQLVFIRSFTNSASDLFTMPLAGGTPRRITNEHADILGIAWLASNHRILLSSNRAGPYCLWVLDTETGSITAVPISGEQATDPSADAKGDRIVFADTVFSTTIRRIHLDGTKYQIDKNEQALVPSPNLNNSARYSPDNTKVAFISDRSGTWELWVADLASNEPRRLTHFNGPMVGTPHWSPDGKKIVFDARPNGVSNIYAVPADGGEPAAISPDTHEQKQPYWAHDGASIYFYSNRDGQSALWKTSPTGGDLRLICHCAAMDPQESVDGKTVYFTSRDSPGLFQVSSSSGNPRIVTGLDLFGPDRLWEVTGEGIFFIESAPSSTKLNRYDLRSQRVVSVTTLSVPPLANTPSLSVSSDQHSVLLAFREESRSNIKLLESGKQ